ncbi:MAG: alpha/beta hydrolase [Pseudomonadota bacterium]
MDIERRALLTGAAALLAASAAGAQDYKDPAIVAADPWAPIWPAKERFALWPGTPPGAPHTLPTPGWQMFPDPNYPQLWIRGIAVPEVNVFRPALPDGSAILAIPGGGYGFLAVQNEGLHPAERFNAERTTMFVLSYRLPGEGWANRSVVPLQDAQRAMRLIRARAAEFKIDPRRLGVLGFSAGGHLAADLSVSYDERVYAQVDSADAQSARPAFAGLIYPVTTLDPDATHGASRDSLLGLNPTPALVEARSPQRHVNGATPPSFVVHAFDDGLVPVENSLRWIAAARAAKVPVEAHLLAEGGHGFGLHLPRDNPGSRWPDLFALWMRQHGG